MCYDRITVLPSLATPVLLKNWRFDFSQKSVTKGCFGSHIFRRTFPFALKFGNLLYLRLNCYCCKNERYSISRKKAQYFESQIQPLKIANFSTKNTFKYSANDSLKQAKKIFTIEFDYEKLQTFLFPLPIISEQTLIELNRTTKVRSSSIVELLSNSHNFFQNHKFD